MLAIMKFEIERNRYIAGRRDANIVREEKKVREELISFVEAPLHSHKIIIVFFYN